MNKNGKYVKVIGLTFDPIEGIEIITDINRGSFEEAGKCLDGKEQNKNIFYIGVPCEFTIN